MSITFPTVAEYEKLFAEYLAEEYAPVGRLRSLILRQTLCWVDGLLVMWVWRASDGWQISAFGYYGPHEMAVTMPTTFDVIAAMVAMKHRIDETIS